MARRDRSSSGWKARLAVGSSGRSAAAQFDQMRPWDWATVSLLRQLDRVGGRVQEPIEVVGGRPRVLIVEDVAGIAKMYRGALERSGFDADVACDGLRGWLELQKGPPPALLVLDINLPIVGGLALLERLHHNKRLMPHRILIVTTESESDEVERALALGAHGYLFKPVTERELRNAAGRLCREITAGAAASGRVRPPRWLVTP